MKNLIKTLIYGAIITIVVMALGVSKVNAMTPTISATMAGGNSAQITIYGDANSNAALYFINPGSAATQSVGSIGTTNYYGQISTVVNGSTYGINSGAAIYAIVNGQQSMTATWPVNYYSSTYQYQNCYQNCQPYSYYGSQITFSRNNVSVNVGQSANVTLYGSPTSNYYISSNTSGVQATITGNNLYLYAANSGSGTITVCSSYNSSYYYGYQNYNYQNSCGNIYVTATAIRTISLSQNSISMSVGQNQTINIYSSYPNYNYGYNYNNYYNSYTVSNSNPSVASYSIYGNTLYVYANMPGTTYMNVCSAGQCSSLTVTVSGYNYYYPYNYYNNYYQPYYQYNYPYNYYGY